jgi:hypothetical protein
VMAKNASAVFPGRIGNGCASRDGGVQGWGGEGGSRAGDGTVKGNGDGGWAYPIPHWAMKPPSTPQIPFTPPSLASRDGGVKGRPSVMAKNASAMSPGRIGNGWLGLGGSFSHGLWSWHAGFTVDESINFQGV